MATVHRACVEADGQFVLDVALKRLLPHLADDERFVGDFVREAKLAALLHHPNIVRVYELGRIDDVYFIAMELVHGIAISKLLRKNQPPPIGVTLALMLELTDALDYAHDGIGNHGQRINLVHRDLTPSNLLITDDGHLKIIDFGVAKTLTGDLVTSSGFAKGKLGYMSPEALRATNIDGRADLFSAGVVMWELLTGRRLFEPSTDWDLSIYESAVPPPSTFNPVIPPQLDQLVLRACAADVKQRWQSANAMHRALALAMRPYAAHAAVRDVVAWRRSLRAWSNPDAEDDYELLEVEERGANRTKRGMLATQSRREAAPRKSAEARTNSRRRQERTEPSRVVVPRTVTPTRPGEPLPQLVTERQLEFPPEPTSSGEYVVELFVEFEASDFDAETQPPRKRGRAPVRRPAPSPSADRIPRRLQTDTEPTAHQTVKQPPSAPSRKK
jgi:serine/threonine protein kinase